MIKPIFFSSIILIFNLNIYSQVQSGWYWVNPMPQSHHLTSVVYLNSNLIIAAGYNGTILRSSNGGLNWSYFRYNTFKDFKKLKFIDQNTGLAVGDSSLLLRTTDAGLNWKRIAYYSSENFHDLHFFNVNTGFICSDSIILKTTNGGNNFTPVIIPGYSGYYMQFTDGNTGYSGADSVFKTTNSGINWFIISNVKGYSCNFINNYTGYIGGSGKIYKTTNGGVNWVTITVPNSTTIESIKFFNESTGYAATMMYDYIIKTTDSGNSWNILPFQVPGIYSTNLDIIDAGNIVVVGFNGLIEKSTNGGTSWAALSKILYCGIKDITFVNDNTGFAVGDKYPTNNGVLKTTNQGQDWFEFITAPSSYIGFASICFLNNSTGYLGGYGSQIYKTTNSGTSWDLTTLSENASVNDIKFINSTTGFASTLAAIYKTTNSGNNWTRVLYNNSAGYLQKISFPSENTGYAAGETLYKTTNKGNSWFELTRPISNYILQSVCFLDDNTGFVGGHSGIISKTTNGGINWFSIQTNFYLSLSEIEFINASTGYVSGALYSSGDISGCLLKTTNSGLNWESQNLPSNVNLLSVHFVNELTGFIAGDDGTILKTTTGGVYIGIQNISSNIPANYNLSQNYPNPFNPTTTIMLDLPKAESIYLVICDILGRELYHISDEYLKAGSYSFTWDASKYSSGVYFYKLTAGDYTETKKMLLLK